MENLDLIHCKIYEIRGRRVIIDRDIAQLYGVGTKVLNQAVKRHINRFPEDFMFQLTKEECSRSQFVTLNVERGKNMKYLPYAFTEFGVAMLSSVLKSETAIQINISIMRAFVSLRSLIQEPVFSAKQMEQQIKELQEYVEDIFSDQNDINEDTRMQLELINQSLAELQVHENNRTERQRIGFVQGLNQ